MYNRRNSSAPDVPSEDTKPVVGHKRPIVKANNIQPAGAVTYTPFIPPPLPPHSLPRYHSVPPQYVYDSHQPVLHQFGQLSMQAATPGTFQLSNHTALASNGFSNTEQHVPGFNSLHTFTDMAAEIDNLSVSTSSQHLSPPTSQPNQSELESDSDDDSDDGLTHPNKFPVEIEYHENQYCVYKRQNTRSGPRVKQRKGTVYNPTGPSLTGNDIQQVKYYQKDLVRICRCGKYNQMDGALVHGRANDCDGYEIHYSQKCKWKAYDDYKTGKRVLIRLCKCYKPML